jgi:hypothetical protein
MMRTFAAFALCVLVSCSAPVAPTVIVERPIDNIAEYFWPSGGTFAFADTNGAVTNTITFSGSIITDASHPALAATASSDTVYAAGFGVGSLIEPKTYFSALDTEIATHLLINDAIIGESAQGVIATDSGVFRRMPNPDSTYTSWGLDGISVTHLAKRDLASIRFYAATRDGSIWHRDAAAAFWTQLPAPPVQGSITEMTVGPDGILFVAIAGNSGFYQFDGTAWSHPSYLATVTVTAFGGQINDGGPSYLLIGTSSGIVGFYAPGGKTLPQFKISSQAINALEPKAGNYFLAGCGDGLYIANTGGTVSQTIRNLSITSLALEHGTDNLYFLSQNTIYISKGSAFTSATAIGSVSGEPYAIHSVDSIYISARDGVVVPNGDNNRFHFTWGFPIDIWPYAPGGLTLLQKDLFSRDSSWRAGTMVDDKHHSYRVTAHVLGRLDSLQIQFNTQPATQHTYGDILIVDYSYQSDARHEWIVYYQRGRGPIMFDTRDGGKLIDRRAIKESP